MKKIGVLNNCVKCGICAQMTNKLKEKSDGSIEVVGNGFVADSEMRAFDEVVDACPVNAIVLKDSGAVGNDLNSLKKALIDSLNKFKHLSINPDEYKFDASQYSIPIPRSPRERDYSYKKYEKAEREGLREFDNIMYSQRRQIVQKLLVEYKVNVLNKFIDYSETSDNFYFKINTQIGALLKEFANTAKIVTNGNVNLGSSFTEFKMKPSFGIKESHNDLDSHTYVWNLRHIEECYYVDRIVDALEPLDWFETFVDVDDEEDRRGKYVYGYKLGDVCKTLAKYILSEAASELNYNSGDGVGDTINSQLKRYQEMLNVEIDKKISEIKEL